MVIFRQSDAHNHVMNHDDTQERPNMGCPYLPYKINKV